MIIIIVVVIIIGVIINIIVIDKCKQQRKGPTWRNTVLLMWQLARSTSMSHGGRCAPELLPLTPRQCRVLRVQAVVTGAGLVLLHAAGLITRLMLVQSPIA